MSLSCFLLLGAGWRSLGRLFTVLALIALAFATTSCAEPEDPQLGSGEPPTAAAKQAVLGAACTGGPGQGTCDAGEFCVDGVCCNEACGAGDTTDCRSCLGAQTGGSDGTCGDVTAGASCADGVCNECNATGSCVGSAAAFRPGCSAGATGCSGADTCDGAGPVS